MAQPISETVYTDPHTSAHAYQSAGLVVQPLCATAEREVLEFLGARPLHTVILVGWIRDNGLVSPLNRGTFYGCRDAQGGLVGVALIGHITQIETDCDVVLAAFAAHVCAYAHIHMIMGEAEKVGQLWRHCAYAGRTARAVYHDLMFVQRQPLAIHEPVAGLRQATRADLELVAVAHAELAASESGINPLHVDPVGFRGRTARRIEQERVWVWIEQERLIFKADVISDTPAAIYLEGVYVDEAARGHGYGLRCLSQLSRVLLSRAELLCLLVNERNNGAQAFYRRLGFKLHSRYESIFLQTGS